MMRQYELVERVLKYDPKADEALLNRAYVYAMKAHGNQKRASGAPYFSHPLEVAAILTELKLDDATIATALLHDVIEDTDATRTEIDQMFGPEIGSLVDGLTKIKRLDLVSKKAEQAEDFRKLLIAISSDIRVLLVKLADRLHNMRTLEHMKPESRRRNSEETLDIYAPLAGLMGMQTVREELEDHAFRWLHPEAYQAVTEKLVELRARNKGLVEEIRQALARKFSSAGIKAEASGREKKPYSIWSKMEHKQISLEQLSDLFAFRVTVDTIEDCYRALGIVHTTWGTVPGRFKDYISAPKRNNYQSIHTTVYGPRHQRVELQIRTHAMHRVAEFGIAAHALYKEQRPPVAERAVNGSAERPGNGSAGSAGNGSAASAGASAAAIKPALKDDSPYGRLRVMISTLLQAENPEEFLEHTKLELFQDQVFCFTPKGRLIALPRGATPLDFAYAVHTDIGNEAIAAFINGRHVPIDTRLRNGDEVVIETSKSHARPAAWEAFAVTGRARAAIRRAAREAEKRRYIELGRQLVSSALSSAGLDYVEDKIKAAAPRFNVKTTDEVLAAVGRNDIALPDLLKALVPASVEAGEGYKPQRKFGRAEAQDGWFNIEKVTSLKFRASDGETKSAISIRGPNNDLPVLFAPGGAVPGDRIVGVMSPGEGIRIFQIHAPRLNDFEHASWIDVTWDIDPEHPQRFPAKISVTAVNAPGSLAEIAKIIGESGGNIDNVKMARRAADFTVIQIELEVFDLVHLNHIIGGLRARPTVAKVERHFE